MIFMFFLSLFFSYRRQECFGVAFVALHDNTYIALYYYQSSQFDYQSRVEQPFSMIIKGTKVCSATSYGYKDNEH